MIRNILIVCCVLYDSVTYEYVTVRKKQELDIFDAGFRPNSADSISSERYSSLLRIKVIQ